MRLRFVISILILLSVNMASFASHIVGGNLGYAFLGNGQNGLLRYKIILTTYTDCSPTSEIPQPENMVSIGLYLHDAANPNANKILKEAYAVPLISSELITPPLPPGCSIGLGTCINKGVYELEILVEPSVHGYHLYYERCCRNTALVNIINPAQTSTGFYAFIPPTSIQNSTPVFIDDPVPLICVQDSLFILNTAIDPDGDFLLYSFTTPMAGFANTLNPAPMPEPILQWPITPIIYQGGFSQAQPFGPGGYTSINALNGSSVYKTSLPGNFALAVQVSEYRNNVLISTTRRDMQFIGLACPMNKPPVGQFSMGLNIQAVEGDTLCFDFSFNDPDMDSVFLEVAGEPFLAMPAATFNQQYSSSGSVEGNVCWVPPCGSARPLPYLISYSAHDNGCIPKSRVNIMQITVVPDTARMTLNGDTLVCALETATYQTSKTSGLFSWTVNGGSQTPTSTTSSATIDWNLAPAQTGNITVIRNGLCRNDTASLSVNIAPPQFANQMPAIWICPGSLEMLQAEPGGTNYLWTPNTWLNDSTVYNPYTNTPDSLVYHVIYKDSLGCEKFDSLLVAANNQVPVNAGNDFAVCEGVSITLGGNPTGPSNANFQWSPGGVLSNDTVANPSLIIPQEGWYYVEVFVDTCHAKDSLSVSFFSLPSVDAGHDTTACFGTSIQLNGSGTGNANWHAAGTSLSSNQILNPVLNANAGTYSPILTITSPEGCSKSDTVEIVIFPLPDLHITGGNSPSICRGDTALLQVTGADSYLWNSTVYLSSNDTPFTYVYTDSIAWIYVQGADSNACVAFDSILVEVFRAHFQLDAGSDGILCLGDSVSLSFISSQSVYTHWEPSDYLTSNTGQTVVSRPTHDISYTAYATNMEGCTDSASVSLTVKELPVLEGSVTYTSKLFCEHVEINITTDNITDSIQWLLNGTLSGNGTSASIHLNPKNPETVYLSATTEFGCKDTIAVDINFDKLEQLIPTEFPNIITPNGDLINDLWDVSLPDGFADCMRLSIFNRWGNQVFGSDTYPLVWNGKTKQGIPLSDGVYFYVLEIGGIYKKGTVTIAR